MTAARGNQIDTSVAHPARRYNYWLGGKDHFAADRASGDTLEQHFPGMRTGVQANRDVLERMVRYLTADCRMRQFLDIGTGLPVAEYAHQIAQRIDPTVRVVYVDNDPMVGMHAEVMAKSTPEGRTAFLDADLRSPAEMLADPRLRSTLDLDRPIALLLVAVLHFIPGDGEVLAPVRALVDALPTGSYLAATHFTTDFMPVDERVRYDELLAGGHTDIWPRGRAEFAGLFDGLAMVDPGITLATSWRPASGAEHPEARLVSLWAGVGRKA